MWIATSLFRVIQHEIQHKNPINVFGLPVQQGTIMECHSINDETSQTICSFIKLEQCMYHHIWILFDSRHYDIIIHRNGNLQCSSWDITGILVSLCIFWIIEKSPNLAFGAVISKWQATGSWNVFFCTLRTCIYCVVNTMPSCDSVTSGHNWVWYSP